MIVYCSGGCIEVKEVEVIDVRSLEESFIFGDVDIENVLDLVFLDGLFRIALKFRGGGSV